MEMKGREGTEETEGPKGRKPSMLMKDREGTQETKGANGTKSTNRHERERRD